MGKDSRELDESGRIDAIVGAVHKRDALVLRRDEIWAAARTEAKGVEEEIASIDKFLLSNQPDPADRLPQAPAMATPRPRTDGVESYRDQIVRHLSREPGMKYQKLAELVYGDTSRKTKKKLHAQINQLKGMGRVRIIPGRPPGVLEVVDPPSEGGGAPILNGGAPVATEGALF